MYCFSEALERNSIYVFFSIQTVVCHILAHNKFHQSTINLHFTVQKSLIKIVYCWKQINMICRLYRSIDLAMRLKRIYGSIFFSQISQFSDQRRNTLTLSIHWYIRVITKLPNSEQSNKGKVKTHNYINRQNQSTSGKLWKP